VTRGFLCGKVARYLEHEYSPERLLYPQKRAGAKGQGRFARISWDEALDTIATRLAAVAGEFGPESVLPYSYAGTMGLLNGAGMDRRFFHRLGASRLDRTICSTAGAAGIAQSVGFRYGTDPEQFRHARLILAWGANVLGTNAHLWPFIMEARRQGARLYTIDPRRNRTTDAADRHYFIAPGSDTALALAMMHVITGERLHDAAYVDAFTTGFADLGARVRQWTPARAAELTGIPADRIVALAREYATTRPAVIRLNYGVQRSERGGMAVRAIALLPVLTGAWRDVGGGLLLSTSEAFQLDRDALARPDLQLASPLGREARLVNMVQLGHALNALDNPPVKALVVYNSNPAATAPDQNAVRRGLAREDLFTVVLEQVRTDTADFADILLPATTFLEHADLYLAYGHYYLQYADAAVAPPGEVRSNLEVFRELAAYMGFEEACFLDTEEQMARAALASGHPFLEGITFEDLRRERSIRLRVGDPFLPFTRGDFGAPGRRCDFAAASLDYQPPLESRRGDGALRARFPLELISPKCDDSLSSTFGYRVGAEGGGAKLHMHAADAAPRGISTGDPVRVFNDRGACRLTAEVDSSTMPGVVSSPSVRWAREAEGERNTNALASDRLTDMGGGPTFYNCLVQVEREHPS
jgi:anaerobic selenocysteine-containing dehydrogenase